MHSLEGSNPDSPNSGAICPSDFIEPSPEMIDKLSGHIDSILNLGTTIVSRSAVVDLIEPAFLHNLYFKADHIVRQVPKTAAQEERYFALLEANEPLASISTNLGGTIEYCISNPLRLQAVYDHFSSTGELEPDVVEQIRWLIEPLLSNTKLASMHRQPRPRPGAFFPTQLDLVFKGETKHTSHGQDLKEAAIEMTDKLSQNSKTVQKFGSYQPGRYVRAFREKYAFDESGTSAEEIVNLDFRDLEVQFGWYTNWHRGGSGVGAPLLLNPPTELEIPGDGSYSATDSFFKSKQWEEFEYASTHIPTVKSVSMMNAKLADFLKNND